MSLTLSCDIIYLFTFSCFYFHKYPPSPASTSFSCFVCLGGCSVSSHRGVLRSFYGYGIINRFDSIFDGVYAASGFHLSLLLQANHSEHPHSWFLPHFLSTDKRPAPWSLASGSEDLNILIWIDSAPKVGPTYSFSSRSVVSLTSASL